MFADSAIPVVENTKVLDGIRNESREFGNNVHSRENERDNIETVKGQRNSKCFIVILVITA